MTVRTTSPALRLEPISSLDSIREEWDDLAARSGNIFATWEWNSIWWRHFGGGRPLAATACRAADGSLLAILPLYLWSARPLRVARGPVTCATAIVIILVNVVGEVLG